MRRVFSSTSPVSRAKVCAVFDAGRSFAKLSLVTADGAVLLRAVALLPGVRVLVAGGPSGSGLAAPDVLVGLAAESSPCVR